MDAVDLALIGCGTIGSMRARTLAENPAMGAWHLHDQDLRVAQELARSLPHAVVHASLDAALTSPDVGGAVVSTSESAHVAAVERALEHALPTLVEKPLAHSATEAQRLAAMAATAEVPLYVGYTQRFRRRYLAVKELLEAGTLGRMDGATAKIYTTRDLARRILQRSPETTPSSALVTNLVDLLMWYFAAGAPLGVTAASIDGAADGAYPDTPASTWALLGFEGGRVANLASSWDLPANHPANATISMDVFGDRGFVTIDDSHRELLVATRRGVWAPSTPEAVVNAAFVGSHLPGDVVEGRVWGPIRAESDEFLRTVATGSASRLLAPARHAAEVVAITRAIDESAATGRPVQLHAS